MCVCVCMGVCMGMCIGACSSRECTDPLAVDDDILEAADEEVGPVGERRERGAGGAEPRGGERRHRRVVRLDLADGVDGLLLVRGQHQVRRVYRHEHLTTNNNALFTVSLPTSSKSNNIH